MQTSPTDNNYTVGSLLQFPFDQWNPETLIARSENKEIPFQTSAHRSIVAAYLIQNKEKINTVFEKSIRPIIDIQNRLRKDLKSKKIEELDFLNDNDNAAVCQNLPSYMEVLNQAYWVLPVEGFIESSMISEKEMPKCFGQISMHM